MKTSFYLPLLFCLLATSLFSQSNIQQSLSVNSTGAAADASAQLDVSATDKGMLVPRMISADRTAIASPATGLLVFDTTTGGFWFYNGTSWVDLSSPKVLADADADTKIQVEESPDEDIIRFDLGGTENMVLRKNGNFPGTTRLELIDPWDNTFVGEGAGSANTVGGSNMASGNGALHFNTDGGSNTASGAFALHSNTVGDNNTANGKNALYFNTSGDNNTASGWGTLTSNTSGEENTASGIAALYFNTVGNGNTANGRSCLGNNTTGFSNTAIGSFSLFNNSTRSNLVAVGDSSLFNNGTGATVSNHATGNTALGSKALYGNTTGFNNTAVGRQALFSNTTGANNTCVGVLSGDLCNANFNSFFGFDSGGATTTGAQNTFIGSSAGNTNTTGSDNTTLGDDADLSSSGFNNSVAIGNTATVNASNKVRIGNGAVTVIEGQVDWTFPSDARFKFNIYDDAMPGLAFIEKLRPVTYQFDTRKFDEHLMQNMPDSIQQRRMAGQDYSESTAIVQTGFLAQEVEQACKDLDFEFSGLHVPTSEVDNYGLAYGSFVPLLVKAVQEQQKVIEIGEWSQGLLTIRVENLEAENAALKSQLDKITAALQGAGIAVEK